MWTCQKCGEQHQDDYDSCWKCAKQDLPEDKIEKEEPDSSPSILKISSRLALMVSIIWLFASFQFYNRGGPQSAGLFNQGVVATAEFIVLAIYISMNLALPFSLSFTPFLGIALLIKIRSSTHSYRKAIQTFTVSLIPFSISLYCFCGFILPAILSRFHKH